MSVQPPGYLRPVQSGPLNDAEENRIASICPGLGQSAAAGEGEDHPMWGAFVAMRTGHATDAGLRFAASSGGALSAILTSLLDSGRIDAVLHTGADPGLPIGNVAVLSRTVSGIRAGAGSRYAPSAPMEALAPHLDSETRFVFVGKPCDVAALRTLSKLDDRVAERVPETAAFRYRGHGWPGAATATLSDGSTRSVEPPKVASGAAGRFGAVRSPDPAVFGFAYFAGRAAKQCEKQRDQFPWHGAPGRAGQDWLM
ncbi:coenzyme F420 hydrogenase/dehydrogenase beta subunit N-terminal domain-containing protein [Sedimentitalea xiamensis]|uniref:coenzyme F420 hydrogenase/dehydrogenase beta subunit N-terminal domain-containing protein n=1 Tax=Sedimentitalea xiamensis TaxID=3050037 RepID=UPI003899CB10